MEQLKVKQINNMEKYYTPDLEEFHLGFRYESGNKAIKGTSTEWYKDEIEETYELESVGDYQEVRVKYLDRKDIEELGWKYDGEIFNGNMLEFYHPNEGDDDYSRKLQFPKDIDRLIEEGIAIGSGYFDFCGDNYRLKNYNELKTLMKQIGII